MKPIIKTIWIFIAMLWISTSGFAYDFYSGDLFYNILSEEDRTAEVTFMDDGFYNENYVSGAIEIPQKVIYQSKTYTVTSIGDYAFYNCSSLTSVTIPNSVTSIGNHAFSECSSLTSVTIPNSVTSIGKSAFEYCSSLTSVTIPNSVTSIGISAFNGCSKLENINVDLENAYYTSIDGVLYNKEATTLLCCPGHKTSVTIPNSVTSIGISAFSRCSSLTSVTIPNSVTSIGEGAFYECPTLTSVTIPNSVTSIGYNAFRSCTSLTSVTLSNSLTSIGHLAFHNCSELENIYVQREVPLECGTIFSDGSYEKAVLHVPTGTIEAYKKVDPWRNFWSIEEMESVAAETISLNSTTISLKINETCQLTAKVSPDNTTDKTVTWTSSDDGVAKVSDTGLVTGVSAGEAIVKASCGEISTECKVTVSGTTSIDEIATSPDSKFDVYNINGIMIKKACTVDALHKLPKGIYIVVSGNKRYKIAI